MWALTGGIPFFLFLFQVPGTELATDAGSTVAHCGLCTQTSISLTSTTLTFPVEDVHDGGGRICLIGLLIAFSSMLFLTILFSKQSLNLTPKDCLMSRYKGDVDDWSG